MTNLAVVCALLLILPFLLSYIHTSFNKKVPAQLLTYRYFMTFNMILAGVFVAGRMFLAGHQAAAITGWNYSPIFHLYGIAVLSMALMGAITVYSRKIIMLSPAICWSFFLILSTISHLYQLTYHQIADVNIIYVHIIYNVLVTAIMLRYVYLFNHNPKERTAAQRRVAAN